MSAIRVRASGPLHGEAALAGAKNSVLKLMAATTLAEGRSRLRNVPDIADVDGMTDLLVAMGAEVRRTGPGELEIDQPADLVPEAPYELVERMRASIVVLGPLRRPLRPGPGEPARRRRLRAATGRHARRRARRRSARR